MEFNSLSESILHLLRVLLLLRADDVWWTTLSVWLVRLIAFSLLMRTYLIPWAVGRMSRHLRVRSISFRSVRGLYARFGAQTLRADRITWKWSQIDGSRRLTFQVHGVTLEVGASTQRPPDRHKRALTLADFAPSPIAHRLWVILSQIYSLIDPFLRPLIRTYFVWCLRILIRWVPGISQALALDVHSPTITFAEIPGAKIVVTSIFIRTVLAFTQMEKPAEVRQPLKTPSHARTSYSVAAWRRRLTSSVRRSWERAWGQTRGSATVELKLQEIVGTMNSSVAPSTRKLDFFTLPGSINFDAALGFSPKHGSVEPRSVKVSLAMTDAHADLRALIDLMTSLKRARESISADSELVESPISPNPAPNFRDSLYSPLLSPTTPSLTFFSPTSPITPRSPFFGAFSGSITRRHISHVPPCVKLKERKDTSSLAFLAGISFRMSKVTTTITQSGTDETHRVVLHDINSDVKISHPDHTPLHRRLLGRAKNIDMLDPQGYAFNFTTGEIQVDRISPLSQIRLLGIKSTDLQTLGIQWPLPWLHPSPFIGGDPNVSLFALHLNLGAINLTERLDRITRLFDGVPHPPHLSVNVASASPPSTASQEYPLPRISLEVECKPICGRLIVGTKAVDPSALDLRTDGFVISTETRYSHRPPSKSPPAISPPLTDFLPLHLHVQVAVVLRPIFLRVCYRRSDSAQSFLEDPLLLSMEAMELTGHGKANASICQDGHAALVDLHSKTMQLHCTTDALSVELWHPLVIDTLTEVLSSLPVKSHRSSPSPSSSSIADKMPRGLFLRIALARCVIFVTAPDINPDDTMDLCRGFAARATGLSMQYCSLRANPDRHSDWRSSTRQKLYLPPETSIATVLTALRKSSTAILVSVTLPDLMLRSAVSTQYDADDPDFAERDDPNLEDLEFLHLKGSQASLSFSSGMFWPTVSVADTCEVGLDISYVHGALQLAHMYSVLLGISTLKQLAQARPRLARQPTRTPIPHGRPLVLKYSASIRTVQIFCTLLKQRAVLRLDTITALSVPDAPIIVKLDKAIVWVKVHVPLTGCQSQSSEERWEEFFCLQKWIGAVRTTSIEIEADNARIRIPYGFILADLILDISVIFKSVRHLARICTMGRYYAMPIPEAEGPKAVPKLLLNVRSLCVEAADDPLEIKLGIISRTGLEAAKHRKDRDEAFEAKVQSILAAESLSPAPNAENLDYGFDANHSISIDDARARLDEVHSVDWAMRVNVARQRQIKDADSLNRKHFGAYGMRTSSIPNLVSVTPASSAPPLIRLLFTNVALNLAPPSFPISEIPNFLHKQGNGLPTDTAFSLLVPLHLNFGLSSLRVTLRDYPIPLVYIPPHTDKTVFVFDFDSDLVVAEEMGTDLSVDWVDCLVVPSDYGLPGAASFALSVPKTIMPVKSYADPVIDVTATAPTTFSWGVSYGPATQDLMRVVDTLSSAPRDSSPVLGFWDKMRLIFHWSVTAKFVGEVQYQMKGLRDPYIVNGVGAGFVLAWQGNTKLLISQKNNDTELIQVTSDSMLIAIPDFSHLLPKSKRKQRQGGDADKPRPFQKICAKFRAGVCFGVGFVMERSCGPECSSCNGAAFYRKCRFYDFRPHYNVKLEKKPRVPAIKSTDDSYNGFRSDFIHLSVSLTSALNAKPGIAVDPSSLHLTPQVFTHFWSWWKLFDGVLSLPIRQGSAWPARHISPKFGRHLATLKYRIAVKNLYIMHAYLDNSRETWADGVTPWIGVKGIIKEFQVDMHQREEEVVMPGTQPNTTKLVRRKPFYAIELVILGLDLRAMLATFDDPLKTGVGVSSPPQRSNYRTRTDLPITPLESVWNDEDDFIELDWIPSAPPRLHFLPVVTCPRFTYFRRAALTRSKTECSSKFGSETTHTCYLGTQPSVLEVQVALAKARIAELQESIENMKDTNANTDLHTMQKMLKLLQDYTALLGDGEGGERSLDETKGHSYHIPADTVSEAEWAEFDNVYQIHCPKIYLDSAIRDIMMQYYYCSTARRGVEYHMATRAVKFIRDQAEQVGVMPGPDKHRSLGTAQAAAHALRKILTGHERKSLDDPKTLQEPPIDMNPLDGWFEGVSLQKGHCCLLLKPQIVLRDEWSSDQTCVVAAVQTKLQSYAIMDDSNVDDPVSGKVMSRTFTTLSGLQTFSPASPDYTGDGCVPIEVLIDFRCESNDFERLVPQTDATFHYDKFNRLRLRNNVTSVIRSNSEKAGAGHNHLHDQTDLIQVNIPQFTVTANDQHFQTISSIVTKLLLFSDAAHKTRMNKLETLLFTYDFNDLASVANVVTDLQTGLRGAIETELIADVSHLTPEAAQLEMLKLKAHKMLLGEELGGFFECIRLAQDQRDNKSEPKSALLLHTSSSEISWRMLDEHRELLAKLVVQNIDFFWLSRQDSSTVNSLTVGNLQAFDGSHDARWAEILSKHDEPANHPLLKRGLFVLANWSILAPVGGITIYESFELNFHPMRLQVDTKVGRRIMEYVWPARKTRKSITEDEPPPTTENSTEIVLTRSSLDSPRSQVPKKATQSTPTLAPPMKLSASRSFTDLRSAAADTLALPMAPKLHRTASSGALRQNSLSVAAADPIRKKNRSNSSNKIAQLSKKTGDAAEMKTRSSQKSFVLVRISSLNLLLSIMKEESFACRDAHIRTRDLEFRNQTWSFEELVGQFIPSDTSWRGWLKMAFQQPLVPVLPVARELISKTKWIANKSSNAQDYYASPTPHRASRKAITHVDDDGAESDRSHSPHSRWRRSRKRKDTAGPAILGSSFTAEPDDEGPIPRPPSRNRKFTLFGRSKMISSTTVSDL